MDVLVGGEYAGGMPVSITDSGGCADNPDMVELSADVASPRRVARRKTGARPPRRHPTRCEWACPRTRSNAI